VSFGFEGSSEEGLTPWALETVAFKIELKSLPKGEDFLPIPEKGGH
jgi:hypothetical protein